MQNRSLISMQVFAIPEYKSPSVFVLHCDRTFPTLTIDWGIYWQIPIQSTITDNTGIWTISKIPDFLPVKRFDRIIKMFGKTRKSILN